MKSRNRLTNHRAKDLVFVFTNMRVQKGLIKIQNPQTSIYRCFDQRATKGEGATPLSAEPIVEEEDKAPQAALGEEDVDDFDDFNDADEALQGLWLQHDSEV